MDKQRKVATHPERGNYDRETVNKILDEGIVCHVAFNNDAGLFNIPINYVRIEDSLYIHSSKSTRIFTQLSSGSDVCITVTIVDGIVLAKSAASSSMNFRSAMLFGSFTIVDDLKEKELVFEKMMEKLVPGRWNDSGKPNQKEMESVGVLQMKIVDFSVKSRSGPPGEEKRNQDLPYWTGVIPLSVTRGEPESSPGNGNIKIPHYLKKTA